MGEQKVENAKLVKYIVPKKEFKTVAEREQEVLDSVPICQREIWDKLIQDTMISFRKKTAK